MPFLLTASKHRMKIKATIGKRSYLHRIDQHARETEGDLLREFLARHRHLEAVAEVDVHDLAADATQHQIGRMSVPKAEHVTHHRHHRQRSRVVCTSVEPHLTATKIDFNVQKNNALLLHVQRTSCRQVAATICLRPSKLTISSYLFGQVAPILACWLFKTSASS